MKILKLLAAIILVGFVFASLDYVSIMKWNWTNYTWFHSYRWMMEDVVSWLSPLSFGLAENLFYILANLFGKPYDWAYNAPNYTGMWWNPTGDWQFIWGADRYPMLNWYVDYLSRSAVWLLAVYGLAAHRQLNHSALRKQSG